MRERKLHVEAHEDLQFGCNAFVCHRALRLDKQVERRPVLRFRYLARAQANWDVVITALQVEIPGGTAAQIKRLRQVVNEERLGLKCILSQSVLVAGERMLIRD